MKTVFRQPQIEEGLQNVVLQNRAGNRLTLMTHDDQTQLEWVYKPNAWRRKDFRARNFSNRDNQTELFATFLWPEISANFVRDFDYDPFVTRVHIAASQVPDEGAQNIVTIINIYDENCFAIAADRPLTLAFRPHIEFIERDGLLLEIFADRGEDIVSFVAFDSYETNRYRVLEDGTRILQIYENEVVLVGGEENSAQIERVLRLLKPLSLNELTARNETLIAPSVDKGRIVCKDERWQRVLDLNRRVVLSGLDAGGACFGALNRIYYLIWNRDGSMTTAMMARAGNTDLLKTWAPFILGNPSSRRSEKTSKENGEIVPEWLQILGSRWTKSEDDGIFYCALSLFTLWQTTGECDFLQTPQWAQLLRALDYNIATRFDGEENLFGSDTRGETTLKGSPLYGYDTVNGQLQCQMDPTEAEGGVFRRVFSLYHNVNLFNTLLMIASLQSELDENSESVERYLELAERVRQTLGTRFVNEQGVYHADRAHFADGSTGWIDFSHADYWEYAWAVSIGPFFPDHNVALRSARMVREKWPQIRNYGYCPWNTLARSLREHEMSSAEYSAMLGSEVDEALAISRKFPLRGALTEYFDDAEGWRGLPFSAGSFVFSVTSLMLQSLPCGLAVRASDLANEVCDFRFRTARLYVRASGQGDVVASWTLNGQAIEHSLQIPESLLRVGQNLVEIERGTSYEQFRLYSSSATLWHIEPASASPLLSTRNVKFHFYSPIPCDVVFENYGGGETEVFDEQGALIQCETEDLEDTRQTLLRVPSRGAFEVRIVIIEN